MLGKFAVARAMARCTRHYKRGGFAVARAIARAGELAVARANARAGSLPSRKSHSFIRSIVPGVCGGVRSIVS